MAQPYDLQLPDILGSFYRGKRLAFEAQRAPIEAQQNDQVFQQKQQAFADDQENSAISNIATMLTKVAPAMRPAIYASAQGKLSAWAQKNGLPPPPATWSDDLLPEVQAVAEHLSGAKEGWQNLGNGYIMDGSGNTKQVYDAAKAEKPDWGYFPNPNDPNQEFYGSRQGGVFRDINGNVVAGQPDAPQAPQEAPQDMQARLLALGQQVPGAVPTSGLRSPAHNEDVGGKGNSQHLAGTAMDYKIPGPLKAQFIALVNKNPDLQAIDEGDHIHVQQRHGAKAAPTGGAIPMSRPRYKPAGTEEDVTPTQDEVDFYAQMSNAGDNSWAVGLARGKAGQALISAVRKRAVELAKGSGASATDVAANRADRTSLTKTLADRQKYVTSVEQLNGTLNKQADLVISLMDKGAANGQSPVINRWIQAGRKAIAGDPDVTAFDTAIRGLGREHQRVLTGPMSNAQLQASAAETADSLINKDMSKAQILATIKVMRTEAKNGKEQGEATLADVRRQLRELGKSPSSTPASGADYSSIWK